MKVVLFEPEIPQNTGNIVRTCALTRTSLVLVRPLGFSITDRMLKRSGLDYWQWTDIEVIDDLQTYLKNADVPFYFFSKHAKPFYTEIPFSTQSNAILIFGSETKGLPPSFKEQWENSFYTIPCSPIVREKNPLDSGCLNLANAVSIVLYESLRQKGFASCL